jgi:hypothetical protein
VINGSLPEETRWKTTPGKGPNLQEKKAPAFQEADAFVEYGQNSPYIFVRNSYQIIRFLHFVKAFFTAPGRVFKGSINPPAVQAPRVHFKIGLIAAA